MARLAIALLATGALAGHLGSVAHLAAIQHVTCAEHGELVEVSSGARSQSALARTRAIEALVVAAHAHDHCAIAASRRERMLVGRDALSDPSPPATAAASVSTRSVLVPRPIALLALAPKSSPPA